MDLFIYSEGLEEHLGIKKKIRAEKFNFSSIFKGNFLIVIIENTLTICEEKLFLYSLCIQNFLNTDIRLIY